MGYSDLDPAVHERRPWNADQTVGPKRPLKPRDIWAIRFYLDEQRRLRDRALFDLAIDSKLRGCDLVKIKIGDVVSGGQVRNRATVIQLKTGRPVQFEIMTEARRSLATWLQRRGGTILVSSIQAGLITLVTSAHGNMRVLLTNGSRQSGSTSENMARIRCVEPGSGRVQL
jgi:integrase